MGVGERLPLGDRSFDVVLGQLDVPLMEEREVGVREVARAAMAGAAVAACVWDSQRVPLLRSFCFTLTAHAWWAYGSAL